MRTREAFISICPSCAQEFTLGTVHICDHAELLQQYMETIKGATGTAVEYARSILKRCAILEQMRVAGVPGAQQRLQRLEVAKEIAELVVSEKEREKEKEKECAVQESGSADAAISEDDMGNPG